MKWDYASEALEEAILFVGTVCLFSVLIWALFQIAKVSVSAAVILFLAMFIASTSEDFNAH